MVSQVHHYTIIVEVLFMLQMHLSCHLLQETFPDPTVKSSQFLYLVYASIAAHVAGKESRYLYAGLPYQNLSS